MKWTKYQHGNETRKWIFKRYFLLNHFQDMRTSSKGVYSYRLYRIAYVPIIYHVKIISKANLFLKEYEKYFYKRKKFREEIAKRCSQKTTFVKKTNNSRVYSLRVVRIVPFAGKALKALEPYAGKLAQPVPTILSGYGS